MIVSRNADAVFMSASCTDGELQREYRALVERDILGPAIRSAMMLFFFLQTFVFIPADYILFPDRFAEFFIARLAENGLLAFLYYKWSHDHPVQATAISSLTGSALFLYMVHVTGGVESGYYVGIILLLVGIAVLTPLSGKQSSLIAGTICLSYASLPWTSHGGEGVNWSIYAQHLFFLGSACVEAGLACLLMDRMRFNDFSQRRELTKARDELAELDKAKSRFSANVHHELRTPLTLILSPLDALRSGEFGDVPSGLSPVLDTMYSNGRRLHKMINNLLDLSKIEGEQYRIVRRPTRIDRLVNELTDGARPMAARKGIEIDSSGFESPMEIAVDADSIEKVIVNLLGNALKFTPQGGRIEIIGTLDTKGFSLSISDTGIGIPADQIENIFDRFAQVDSSATRSYEGTGIGLSLAEEMVLQHGGKIWAESDGEGRGTTMHVWLPNGICDLAIEEDVLSSDTGGTLSTLESIAAIEADLNLEIEGSTANTSALDDLERHVSRLQDQNYQSAPSSIGNIAQNVDSRASVVIAEDNPDMRQLLVSLVGRHYRVTAARNGREALEHITREKPDLVLSDVMMPEMDGAELCRRIRNDPEISSIPVVLVTSKAENEMKLEGLELGANDYVTKPFHPRELLARIGSLIRSNVLRRELAVKNSQLSDALDELRRTEVRLVQNERLAAVGELAAGIAHEVNNPVNFALNGARALARTAAEIEDLSNRCMNRGMGNAVQKGLSEADHDVDVKVKDEMGVLTAEAMELARIVEEGLERTQALVADLRDFAAPKNKERVRTYINVEACVKSAINLMSPTFSQSDVQVSLETTGKPFDVEADSGAIGQVFLNLLKNAYDAAPASGGRIALQISFGADSVEILISDNGPGIDETTRSRLFEPFFTTKPAGEGTGLGLAVSRRIIGDHFGVLDFVTSRSEGTSFRVRLPRSPEMN